MKKGYAYLLWMSDKYTELASDYMGKDNLKAQMYARVAQGFKERAENMTLKEV